MRDVALSIEHRHRARGDDAGVVGIETADEHGQAPECGLLDGIKKVLAPLNRGANAAVPLGRRPPRPAQFTQVGFEAGDDLVGRHDANSGGRQLDPEREVVEPGADVEDGGFGVVIRDQL